ncbi:dipeptidyl carboxypeptidase Dcp [Aquipluma nitroreducens]|uniref:Dipeptidyl carboxypeptidase Dcp n=1 Tax=Aquipluma nitroreducens TaxID=2010828 RepID=A0A5K7SDX9_9BACT|nr:M3 family metallopeptidase [Aquipluma nitroreducens]BBE19464.1 dipeptidyl carboxypeptidase Dcp [Aquipluma nitroreducens]
MKKIGLSLIALALILNACNTAKEVKKDMNNPFFKEYTTPFQVPPFNEIKLEHYMPAVDAGIADQIAEIKAITDNKEEATFNNTILAFDLSGDLLNNVGNVFFNLNSANTNDEMQALAREITPKLSAHRDNIMLNKDLFKRVKAVYEKRNDLNLDAEQIRVVEKYYQDFERSGANLPEDKQAELRKLNDELSMAELKFGENALAETNKNFKLVIDNEADLKGLPADVVSAAADLAKADSLDGKWVFTLQKPSMLPFLQFAENRALREKLYKGYLMRGNNGNANDNKEVLGKLVKLREQKAKLLGFNNWAAYVVDVNMAKTPEKVNELLMKLWTPALERAKKERDDMQAMIDKEGGKFKLDMWDWWFYAEKVRKAKYDLDEAQLKPYFKLENVIDGMIYTANKLYGIKFIKRTDLPIYDPEVMTYEVQEADGRHIGIFYMDFHPRAGKSNGAWCTSFRSQSYKDGKMITPVVSIVCNFTRPSGDVPALLSFEEVTTLFHESGHALHALFTDGPYRRTAGSVPNDFVELPSQIMENWASEPEVLSVYAKHYKTGEVIPQQLISKLEKSAQFNQGFETVELLAASLLDMDWHTIPFNGDVEAFEKAAMDKIGLIKEIAPRYRSTYFSHIFSGGYSAGYYVYTWAAVLDADAFDAFKQSGNIFNPEIAARFRTLLTKSGSDEGMTIYKNFRGQEPSIEPLLKRKGLK